MLRGRVKLDEAITKVGTIIGRSVGLTEFPAFCAIFASLYAAQCRLFHHGLLALSELGLANGLQTRTRLRARLIHAVAAFAAAWVAFTQFNKEPLYQGDATLAKAYEKSVRRVDGSLSRIDADTGDNTLSLQHSRTTSVPSNGEIGVYEMGADDGKAITPHFAGRGLDLTTLACSRAVETVIRLLWYQYMENSLSRSRPRQRLERLVASQADALLFVTSAGWIMWAWFYFPEGLTRSYKHWIGRAASVDSRLVEILRKSRQGSFIYGVDTGQAYVLEGMCKDYGFPMIWGNPAKTIPVQCEMVHQGAGPSCHVHKVVKFSQAFVFALAMYLPLQILLKARRPSIRALQAAVFEAVRSSTFLAAFVTLFYYGVCLCRTLVGPAVLGDNMQARQRIDSGYCVGAGCMLCG